ncbi:Coatomer subunit gamma-2 [Portunus trituberculatus]|uniref:Coatomer subunit gamma-2 n=1 Tax=Portunus trituberculatus TaxID=210409 RepID=A0A5B7CYS7_PORTR|nr:Coatomer subunit gamma-2 [Portunus trituberculatus]
MSVDGISCSWSQCVMEEAPRLGLSWSMSGNVLCLSSCGKLGRQVHKDSCVLSSAVATIYYSYMPPPPKTPNSPKAPKLVGGGEAVQPRDEVKVLGITLMRIAWLLDGKGLGVLYKTQFDCTNTLNDQLLESVSVVVEGEGWVVQASLPCASLPYSQPGSCYVLLPIPEDIMATTGTLSATLKFTVRDCDPATGEPDTDEGYEDDYTVRSGSEVVVVVTVTEGDSALEDVEISVADHVQRAARSNFAAGWEELGATNELEDTFALSAMSTLEEAVTQITQFLGMHPCDRSDRIPEGKSSHTLYLAVNTSPFLLTGTYRGGHEVLVRAKLALADGVTMQLTVRSDDPEVSEVIASAKSVTNNIKVDFQDDSVVNPTFCLAHFLEDIVSVPYKTDRKASKKSGVHSLEQQQQQWASDTSSHPVPSCHHTTVLYLKDLLPTSLSYPGAPRYLDGMLHVYFTRKPLLCCRM